MATPKASETKSDKSNKKNLYCYENNKIQLLVEDESTQKYYRPLMGNIFETKKFSFIQKAAMLSLIEMSRRPDEASPSARLQYFLRLNHKDYYFDFHPKNLVDETKMSYLKGLDILLKTFDKSKTLNHLADTLDQQLPKNINISPDFENFLQTYKIELLKNDALSESFFKGDEALTKHESFKRINLKKLITLFNSENISNDSYYEYSQNSLFKVDSGHINFALKCNFDINKENTIKEEQVLIDQKKSHYFALKEGDNFFIAVSSAIIQKPFKNYSTTYFIKSRPSPVPLPICQFNNSEQEIILFSSSGRNPSQHLKHLVSYDIDQVDSFQSLGELLKFSRHLFLSNPDRILYESKRGRKSQLDFFLSMNFPIYHVESLGDIIGVAAFKNGKHDDLSLIVDDRSKARLWCGL
ncbi:MAG: hypothetical protein H7281_11205 [Bacteriovorax sp.]|nr:hypothetical protein [Bacteriovorax sp.]